jgi:hypothetical protein
VNISEAAVASLEPKGQGDLYSEEKVICASIIFSKTFPEKTLLKGHVYGADRPASKTFFAITLTAMSERVAAFVFTLLRLQVITNSLIPNVTLLFVTVKGISNGEPMEGIPGEKDGAVGHGGPNNPYTVITGLNRASEDPRIQFTISGNRRRFGWIDLDCCKPNGRVFPGCLFLCKGFLAFSLLFFTESTSILCGDIGVSAMYYGRAEDVRIIPDRFGTKARTAELSFGG